MEGPDAGPHETVARMDRGPEGRAETGGMRGRG
jgi:hypothetical protein